MAKLLMKLFFFLGIMLFLSPETQSETIYKWINKEGVPCYSNVSPPQDETEYWSITTEKEDEKLAPEKKEQEHAKRKGPASTDRTKLKATKKEEKAEKSKAKIEREILRRKFLAKRIEEKKKSIEEMEKLLRSRLYDNNLRKSLNQKKQSLQQEIENFEKLEKLEKLEE